MTEQRIRDSLDRAEADLIRRLKALAEQRLDLGDNPGYSRAIEAAWTLDPLGGEEPS